MIFAVINQKGGSGKTTLAVHLACYLADQGHRVAFIDGDSQQSATKWLHRTAPEIELVRAETPEKLVEAIESARGRVDSIVADGAPRLNDSTKVLMYMADRILVPVCPSPIDLLATLETKQAIDLVQQARESDGMSPMWVRLVLNRVRSVSEQGKIVSQVLRNLGIPLAEQSLGLRDAYVKAMGDDTVVTRMNQRNKGAAQAAEEIVNLFSEVIPHELVHRAAA
jgi:chromosome partitioning protein